MRKSIAVVLVTISAMLCSLACSSKSNDSTENTTQDPAPPNGDGTNPDTTNPVNPDTTNPDTTDDGGSNTTEDGGVVEPTNQATCVAACEAKHPAAATNNHDLDNTCFFGAACGAVCDNLGQGPDKFPDAVSGAKCDTVKANSYPIGTPSAACSNCLASTPACCTLWVKVFGSDEGKSLNACANTCWEKFPN